jgi:hypothetical protein
VDIKPPCGFPRGLVADRNAPLWGGHTTHLSRWSTCGASGPERIQDAWKVLRQLDDLRGDWFAGSCPQHGHCGCANLCVKNALVAAEGDADTLTCELGVSASALVAGAPCFRIAPTPVLAQAEAVPVGLVAGKPAFRPTWTGSWGCYRPYVTLCNGSIPSLAPEVISANLELTCRCPAVCWPIFFITPCQARAEVFYRRTLNTSGIRQVRQRR